MARETSSEWAEMSRSPLPLGLPPCLDSGLVEIQSGVEIDQASPDLASHLGE